MAFGPSSEFGHTPEASLFAKARRLEVVCRHSDYVGHWGSSSWARPYLYRAGAAQMPPYQS
jgi:hypothetical protein